MNPKIKKRDVEASGVKFFIESDGKEVARVYLYIMKNDLKKSPFGFLEDLYVEEDFRGQGVGTELLNAVIKEAKNLGCYKLVATSRHERKGVHKMYEKNGFENFGIEFKIYFENGK